MGVASLEGAIAEVSGQGWLETTWNTRVKKVARWAHCPSTRHCPPFSTPSPIPPSSLTPGPSFRGQQSLNQNIRSLSGKEAYLPVWDSKITQSKEPKLPAVNVTQNPHKHKLVQMCLHLLSWPHGSFQTCFTPPSPPHVAPLAFPPIAVA